VGRAFLGEGLSSAGTTPTHSPQSARRVVVSRAPFAGIFWLSRADQSHQERGCFLISQMYQLQNLGIPLSKGYTIPRWSGKQMHSHISKYQPRNLGILWPEGHTSPRSPGKGMHPLS